MKRPAQHIIEKRSQRIFDDLIPVEWVVREIKPDYGIDYLVEIFRSGESTGLTFFVQLKGSEQKIENNTFEKQFKIENLKYYASLSLPVLIVCISTETNQSWGIWSNKLIDSIPNKDNQETVKLKLDSENLINSNYFEKIETELKIVNHYGLKFSSSSKIGDLIKEQVSKFINHFFGDTFVLENAYLPNHYFLSFSDSDKKHKFKIEGPFFRKEIEIDKIDIDNPSLHRPIFNENDINTINAKILKLLLVALARENLNGSLQLLKKLVDNDFFSTSEDAISIDPIGILQSSITQNMLLQYNEIIKSIIKKGHYETFLLIDLSYFSLSKKYRELLELRSENLNFAISKTKNLDVKGTCYYNLGNIQRGSFQNDIAIINYFKARKCLPDYEKRKHWWRELAGLLFSKNHFILAERFYKKSIELKEENISKRYFRLEEKSANDNSLIFALIADCLLFQGEFEEAQEWFKKFLQHQNNFNAEWILKSQMVDEFITSGFYNLKLNKEESLKVCENALSIQDPKKQLIQFEKATKLDPTNSLAWFNLGVAENREQNFKNALKSFINAGLLQDNDKEAQFNALFITISQKYDDLFAQMMLFIIQKHGELVANDLSDYLMKKPIPLEQKKDLIERVSKVIEEVKNVA